jgi:NAD(P)-dependent dehydrogenase (short-subunit alcohol dehydrogenase family)
MGRSLARLMAQRGDSVFLLGRNAADLAKSAQDLAIRGNSRAGFAVCDLDDSRTFAPALDAAAKALGRIDCIAITAARFATQEKLEDSPELTAQLLNTNFTQTVLFCEEARRRLLAQGGGTLAVWSSVAGDRGRKPVALYGSTKAGLSHYLESLDHRYHDQGLRVVCIKPGFVSTSMTDGLKPPPFAGHPDGVAVQALAAIDRGTPELYSPVAWWWVMQVVKRLPRFVMRRAKF